MSIKKFYQQTWPELLTQTDPNYTPRSTDLFAVVIIKIISEEEIKAQLDGDPPQNSVSECEDSYHLKTLSN